jgi:CheY-like chemotaxis protein
MELIQADIDLRNFLLGIAGLGQARAASKGLAFRYAPRSSLPEVIRGDEKRVRQVILNLIDNAVKFTDAGEVTLSADHRRDRLFVRVIDTGKGIAPDRLSSIFEPFNQAVELYEQVDGTGLGLTISRQLIECMSGTLQVESRPGEGSTFSFDIAAPETTPSSAMSAADGPAIAGYMGAQKTILVVDDKEQNRVLLETILRPLGFAIMHAASGGECLQKVHEIRPDTVLMDLVMPGMNGLDTTRALRALPSLRNLVIIAISASAFSSDRDRSIEAGCDDFLAKPVRIQRLLAVLQEHLGLQWRYQPVP